ncbi:MAG: CerR family C-terminal domain-containing protein [Acidiferrobacterales bacterium]
MIAPSNEHESDTRQRLIEAAAVMFVEQGFSAAKVRDIVARAGANIAAVNYHFGSKGGLYAAVIQYHSAQVMEVLSQHVGDGIARTPEARLRDYIRSFLQRLLTDTPQFMMSKLVAREMVEPTAAFGLIIEKFVAPQYHTLSAIVRSIAGDRLSAGLVRRCCLSIVGQCLYYQFARQVVARLDPEFGYGPADVERLAEHVVAFSLGGIHRSAKPGAAKVRKSRPGCVHGK